MQAESMTLDPNELVIDMPVDESNVQVKIRSLQANGMIQPVTVWLQDMRIIDGFHRTVAAQRLGWNGIPGYVIDCSEDAFWDARIQSARQHHTIEPDRLAQWMMQSWMQTRWYTGGELYQSMLSQVWEVIAKPRSVYPYKNVEGESAEVLAWFENKAQRWGISVDEIANKLRGLPYRRQALAVELDLSLEQAQNLARSGPERGHHEQIQKWAEQEIATKESPKSFYKWLENETESTRQRILEEDRIKREESYRQHERQRQYEATPEGKAKREKEQRESNQKHFKETLERAEVGIRSLSDYVDTDGAPAMFAEFVQFIAKFSRKHFRDVKAATPNPVALENSRLRAENAKLKERIASLERALGSKESAGPMIASAMAWSSTDFQQ